MDVCTRASGKTRMPSGDITITLNTDGSAIKASVWPIHFFNNELPFNLLFHNVIVGGLVHPPMHLFMNTFVKLLNVVRTIVWCHGDETVHSNVSVVCCCVDAPARASLFKMKRYNGYYGCPWCLLETSPNGGE